MSAGQFVDEKDIEESWVDRWGNRRTLDKRYIISTDCSAEETEEQMERAERTQRSKDSYEGSLTTLHRGPDGRWWWIDPDSGQLAPFLWIKEVSQGYKPVVVGKDKVEMRLRKPKQKGDEENDKAKTSVRQKEASELACPRKIVLGQG